MFWFICWTKISNKYIFYVFVLQSCPGVNVHDEGHNYSKSVMDSLLDKIDCSSQRNKVEKIKYVSEDEQVEIFYYTFMSFYQWL